MSWLLLLGGILANAAASLVMKNAMAHGLAVPGVLTNPMLWLGLVLYGTSFVVYAVSLTLFPLNVAHPILTCGAVATVAAGSVAFYSETLRPTTVLGIVLVMAGVVLIALKAV